METHLTQSFEFDGPYALRTSLRSIQKSTYDPTTRLSNHRFVRAMRTPEGTATLSATLHREEENSRFVVETFGKGAEWAMQKAPSILGIDRPAFTYDDAMSKSADWKKLRQVYKKNVGMRFPKTYRVAQLLIPIVLEQLVTGPEATRAFQGLTKRFSEPAPGPFQPLMLPVKNEVLARLPPTEFLPMGIPRKIGETLTRVGVHGDALEQAAFLDVRDCYDRLTSVRGIGPWTAYCVMYNGLGFTDCFAYGDYHVKNFVGYFLAGKDRSTDDEMVEMLAPFAPHRGVAARLIELSGLKAPQYGPKRGVRPLDPRA